MELTEEDKKFLEEVGEQLRPEIPPLDHASLMETLSTLRWLWESWDDEMILMSNVIIHETCPILYALGKDNPVIIKELELFRDQMVMHVMTRTWQVAKHNDNS